MIGLWGSAPNITANSAGAQTVIPSRKKFCKRCSNISGFEFETLVGDDGQYQVAAHPRHCWSGGVNFRHIGCLKTQNNEPGCDRTIGLRRKNPSHRHCRNWIKILREASQGLGAEHVRQLTCLSLSKLCFWDMSI